jgi:hypothetical protein
VAHSAALYFAIHGSSKCSKRVRFVFIVVPRISGQVCVRLIRLENGAGYPPKELLPSVDTKAMLTHYQPLQTIDFTHAFAKNGRRNYGHHS